MKTEQITYAKIYELALQHKEHQESRRDNINSYISLFSAVIAVIPFINEISNSCSGNEFYIVKLSLVALSLVCVVLSTTWWLNLKRILLYLQAVDRFLVNLEKEQDFLFVKYIADQLRGEKAPDRITKTQYVLPYTFTLIFLGVFIYFLVGIFSQF